MVEFLVIAASALVKAMTTDMWQWAKARFARVFDNDDAEKVAAVERRLEESRAQLEGLSGEELTQARSRVEAAWQTRLTDLVEENPGALARLHAVLGEMQARVPEVATGAVNQQANAYDHAKQVVQGAGTQNVIFGGESGASR